MKKKFILIIAVLIILPLESGASDWPVYKGNIYLTGNNDEITVKNNNLKWLYQAAHMIYNPIVSGGMVYFIDITRGIYCLDEESGKLLWKTDLKTLSKDFYADSKASGKVKYPVIEDNRLYISDNIAVYCLDKRSGAVIWARTAMQDEKTIHDSRSWQPGKSREFRPGAETDWNPAQSSKAIVDGIYSDPVISGGRIFYGTRGSFTARDAVNGRIVWQNEEIMTYSGFPTFYDNLILTQSMDHSSNRFTIFCLNSADGKTVWTKNLPAPIRIFPPVVYDRRIYIPVNKTLYCLSITDGSLLWQKEYSDYITSSPGFTDSEIFFTEGNRRVIAIDPVDGKIKNEYISGEQSSPYFVNIRDQLYVASTFKKKIGNTDHSFASLKGISEHGGKTDWEFTPPFPGAPMQPSANGGIMFLPAGNYLYAVGTDYYPSIIDGGDAIYDPYNRYEDGTSPIPPEKKESDNNKKPDGKKKITITVNDDKGKPIPAELEIKKWDKGKITYQEKFRIDKPGQQIEIPDSDDIEITADSDGHVPKKVILKKDDKEKKITLEKIEKGKGIIVENIHFEIGSARLRKESLNVLDRMIDSMKKNSTTKIEVRGHTDSTGGKELNNRLSLQRASAVTEYMIKKGLSPERVRPKGMGQDHPVADNKTPEGRSQNRRTEFFILEK
jgi:outer membrane protein OmpA-like peptidoglycan-associated protein/outer membrane protein assembly factor BamB